MNKTIQKIIKLVSFSALALFASATFASAQVATVQVMNATNNPGCNFAQCGSSSVSANPGDIISVQIYYDNKTTSSQNVTLSLSPRTQTGTTFSFNGSASNAGSGTVSVNVSGGQSQTATLMSGTARWYKDIPTNNQLVNGVSVDSLFAGSFSVGTLAPVQGNASPNQGVLVVDFQISNNQNQPQTYACNDGIDNDGDGYRDYPSDIGCTSATDNDEYNTTIINIIWGCMDSRATNYNANATRDNGNCTYVNNNTTVYVWGCTNSSAYNYDYRANRDDGSCRYNNNNSTNNQGPTVATTMATNISTSAARLNGIAYANNNNTNVWFEWGQTTSYGNRTNTVSIGTANGQAMSDSVYGLQAGTIYYYRAVAQNNFGTVYGERVWFKTLADGSVASTNTNTTTTRIVYVRDSANTINLIPAQTVPSLIALRIENKFDSVCVGDNLEYTVTYQNVSGKTISNVVLQVVLPGGVSFVRSSNGSFDKDSNTLTIPLGTLTPNQTGTAYVSAHIDTIASDTDIVVTTARMVYTHPTSGAQEDVIAYNINHKGACSSLGLGAAALFGNGFFPTTFFGWLLLILVILILVLIARNLYDRKKLTNTKTSTSTNTTTLSQ